MRIAHLLRAVIKDNIKSEEKNVQWTLSVIKNEYKLRHEI